MNDAYKIMLAYMVFVAILLLINGSRNKRQIKPTIQVTPQTTPPINTKPVLLEKKKAKTCKVCHKFMKKEVTGDICPKCS